MIDSGSGGEAFDAGFNPRSRDVTETQRGVPGQRNGPPGREPRLLRPLRDALHPAGRRWRRSLPGAGLRSVGRGQ